MTTSFWNDLFVRQLHIRSECDGESYVYPYDTQSCSIKFISRETPTGKKFLIPKFSAFKKSLHIYDLKISF